MINKLHGRLTLACVLFLMFCLTQSACNSCNPRPSATWTEAKLIIDGQIAADCSYNVWATQGQQQVYITVTGGPAGTPSWSANYQNVPGNTYNISVPSPGSFTITVAIKETDGQTCAGCKNWCGSGIDAVTYWKGAGTFSSVAATYNVTVGWNAQDGGCVC